MAEKYIIRYKLTKNGSEHADVALAPDIDRIQDAYSNVMILSIEEATYRMLEDFEASTPPRFATIVDCRDHFDRNHGSAEIVDTLTVVDLGTGESTEYALVCYGQGDLAIVTNAESTDNGFWLCYDEWVYDGGGDARITMRSWLDMVDHNR